MKRKLNSKKGMTYVGISMVLVFALGYLTAEYNLSNQEPEYIKLINSVSEKEYIKDVYDCKNFTADGIEILNTNGYETEPYCYKTSENSSHAIIKLNIYISPQSKQINYTIPNNESDCSRAMMRLVE